MFRYTVACTFTDPAVAEAWLAWMRSGHLRDVCDAGASSAEIVACHEHRPRFEARYAFPSRAAFQAYERDHAPRLRAEGLERFPLALGVTYERSTGEVVASYDRATGAP